MFALHKVVNQRLYALVTKQHLDDDEPKDALYDLFENWRDTSFLFQFFKNNPVALAFYGLSRQQAVYQVLHENEVFHLALFEAAESDDFSEKIDILFEPLHKTKQSSASIVQVKAYGASCLPSCTRIYAIRLEDGAFVIVGGLIKTTQQLQASPEGRAMLKLIDAVAKDFEKKGLINSTELEKIVRKTELWT